MNIQELVMRITGVSSGLKGKKWVTACNQWATESDFSMRMEFYERV